jgi:hypothetical protein
VRIDVEVEIPGEDIDEEADERRGFTAAQDLDW